MLGILAVLTSPCNTFQFKVNIPLKVLENIKFFCLKKRVYP
ncbi:hypothetical protein B4167_3696 [Caldibacillus thermoamylovorans]|uniref:Lipoprotein n=1 Tax=Caldibacillus thermoamylovorans TaxID=35841 RepID=A0ABD4A3U6_9BACI|nr:hypothetical protein B4167_3696 [Caldibacillus thermoamylovorans]